MSKEVEAFLKWLESLQTDEEREHALFDLYSKLCRHCGVIGDGECYCTRDD